MVPSPTTTDLYTTSMVPSTTTMVPSTATIESSTTTMVSSTTTTELSTTTMEATTTACPCSIPPARLPFKNDKYTDEWWSNIKNETQSSYNSSFFVEASGMRTNILENGCSIGIDCLIYANLGRTRIQTTIVVVTPDDQIRNTSFSKDSEVLLYLNCSRDGQYTHEGVLFDWQIMGCVGVFERTNSP
ncbi:hypothetical protein L5515_005892 [Caenorhabditis briggsae]|uniref:Uncharacterized protein n=1 Tax=Caenorhabditis briggsae TaxID=6238 RepID=A0AAE9EUJ6_CAEBR|nr:hypothetical protein L5515_005892 [Caenorhabditis briggsae]